MPQSLGAVKIGLPSPPLLYISMRSKIIPEMTEKVESITGYHGKWAEEIEKASPLAISIKKALQEFGNGSHISFSGAEDVFLILPFEAFSLDKRSLCSETYKLLDDGKHWGIHKEYMNQECCQVSKVIPLRRDIKRLCAWIRGLRKVQSRSPVTTPSVLVVQIDHPSFEGPGSGIISLVRWNLAADLGGKAVWNFLHSMDVPVNSLHALRYASAGCAPSVRPASLWQHGRWRWRREEGKAKEYGLCEGNIESEGAQLSEHSNTVRSFTNGSDPIANFFNSRNFISLSRFGMETLGTLKNRTEPWINVLYAPWHCFCQAMEDSYVELAAKLLKSKVKAGKFWVDGEHKAFTKQKLQLKSFTTIIFPAFKPIKYSSEKRDIDSLLAFVNSLQWQ